MRWRQCLPAVGCESTFGMLGSLRDPGEPASSSHCSTAVPASPRKQNASFSSHSSRQKVRRAAGLDYGPARELFNAMEAESACTATTVWAEAIPVLPCSCPEIFRNPARNSVLTAPKIRGRQTLLQSSPQRPELLDKS